MGDLLSNIVNPTTGRLNLLGGFTGDNQRMRDYREKALEGADLELQQARQELDAYPLKVLATKQRLAENALGQGPVAASVTGEVFGQQAGSEAAKKARPFARSRNDAIKAGIVADIEQRQMLGLSPLQIADREARTEALRAAAVDAGVSPELAAAASGGALEDATSGMVLSRVGVQSAKEKNADLTRNIFARGEVAAQRRENAAIARDQRLQARGEVAAQMREAAAIARDERLQARTAWDVMFRAGLGDERQDIFGEVEIKNPITGESMGTKRQKMGSRKAIPDFTRVQAAMKRADEVANKILGIDPGAKTIGMDKIQARNEFRSRVRQGIPDAPGEVVMLKAAIEQFGPEKVFALPPAETSGTSVTNQAELVDAVIARFALARELAGKGVIDGDQFRDPAQAKAFITQLLIDAGVPQDALPDTLAAVSRAAAREGL